MYAFVWDEVEWILLGFVLFGCFQLRNVLQQHDNSEQM